MKISIELNNKTRHKISRKLLEKIAKASLGRSGFGFSERKKIEISVAIVGEKEIKSLNKKYRKMKQVTDVLSFAEYDNPGQLKKEKKSVIFLGEVVVCPVYVKKRAAMDNKSFSQELVKIISHGILHLLGLRHGSKMFEIQNNVILH